jgi:pimeloyl-[acyl-carrier protein] methyl ester esterase
VSFFQEMSLEGAVLIGWSMGVLVALKAFHLLRSRLAGVVLVAGTPRFTVAADFPHGLSAAEVKALAAGLRRDYQKTMGEFFKRMFAKGEIDRSQYQRIVHEIVMGGGSPDRDAARESLQILTSLDLRDRLPLVDRPVLLIHGELDTICPAAASAYMADRLPEAALQIMPGCGHAPFMTRPEQFNGIVARFLAGL